MNKAFMHYTFLFALSLLCLSFCACTQTKKQTAKKKSVSASGTIAAPKEYDAHITGVIKSMDKETKTMVLLETSTAAETVLNYTDFTEACNQYGNLKTAEQFRLGDIVEAYFLSENNEIVKMENSSSAWSYEGVRKFAIQREDEIFRISDRRYQYDPISLVVAQGDQKVDLLTVNEQDTLCIQGIGSRIYSITITQGHGYVRFRHYDQFVGGMVEIGYGMIRNVTEDMLLVVPEGTYQMVMEHGRLRAQKQIRVEQGKELVIDLGEYQTETEKTGKVYFVINPEGAQLNVNGVPVVYTDAVELNYGKNIIQVFQDGYTSYTGKLNVKRAYQVVKINLAKEDADAEVLPEEDAEENGSTQTETLSGAENADAEEDSRQETSEPVSSEEQENEEEEETEKDTDAESGSSDEKTADEETDGEADTTIEDIEMETTETDSKNTITVNAPSGVKVYVNGDYIGKSPVSFEKIIGTFTVALSKKGCDTASYTLTMEDDGESSFLSFPDLVESEET